MSEASPIPRATLVDAIGLQIQDLHASGRLSGEQPLLRIDNREQARQAPFQFDAASGLLHRADCKAIPAGSRSALYGVWEVGAEDPALACPRCEPLGKTNGPARPQAPPRPEAAASEAGPASEARAEAKDRVQDDHTVDVLYGLLSVVSQFGGVLRERGQEYRRSRAGAALGDRVSKIYAGVNERERQVIDVLTASLDMIAVALRDMEGGINGEPPAPGSRPDEAG
jgi:hypothetical protein